MWDKLKEQFNLLKLEKKRLYLITDSEKFISKDDFLDAIASALQGGVDIVQLREKIIPDSVVVEIARKVRTLCDEYGATFLVNDRPDIARIAEADGVHLGQDDISVEDAREILGQNAIIGKSCHNTDEIISAVNEGADYVTFGPIFTTLSKSGEYIDFAQIQWVLENIDIPVFLTGDITLTNIQELSQTGANKFVITNSIMYARVPEYSAREILKYLP